MMNGEKETTPRKQLYWFFFKILEEKIHFFLLNYPYKRKTQKSEIKHVYYLIFNTCLFIALY